MLHEIIQVGLLVREAMLPVIRLVVEEGNESPRARHIGVTHVCEFALSPRDRYDSPQTTDIETCDRVAHIHRMHNSMRH